MGQPAARIGDMHTCPMSTGPVPHVGGPIASGAPTVLIGGMPSARIGDMAICVGPPDTIVKGSATVIICGKPASRMGDSTAHGGVIVIGCPTVLIGDAAGGGGGGGGGGAGDAGDVASNTDAFGLGAVVAVALAASVVAVVAHLLNDSESYAKGITVKGTPEFRKDTKAALDRLSKTATGKSVLADIAASGKQVTIIETDASNGFCKPDSTDANKKADGSAAAGANSNISFNPSFTPGGLPNELVLGHELIHAQHNARGVRESGITGTTKSEELKTVGLPPFPVTGMTENSLRIDLGLPPRSKY